MITSPSLTRNVTSNWAGMVLGIVYALVITPIVFRALDTHLYGIWSYLNSLLAYSELFYLGLGGAIIRYVAEARAEQDPARVNRLAAVVLTIYTAIGVACFLTLLAVSGSVPVMFRDPLAPEVARAAVATCILLGARLFFVFVGSAFSGVMCGHDRFDLVNAVSIGGTAARFVVVPVLMRSPDQPLLTIAALTTAMSAVETTALAGIAFWYVPRLSVWPTRPRMSELKLLYGFGLQSFLVLVAFKLISYTDTLVIGVLLGTASVTLYSFPLMLVEYARLCVGGFAGVLLPRLTVLSSRNDVPQLREAYLSSARIGCFLAGWLGAAVVALGPAFLTTWVGAEIGASSRVVLIWLSVAAFAQALSTQVPYPFYQAQRTLVFPAVVLFAEGSLNLVLSLILAPRYGISGVAFATAFPAVVVSLALLPAFLCRRLDVSLRALAVQGVFPGLLMLGATLATQALLALIVPAESYPALAGRAVFTVPVALAVFAFTFPRDERLQIRRALRIPLGDSL